MSRRMGSVLAAMVAVVVGLTLLYLDWERRGMENLKVIFLASTAAGWAVMWVLDRVGAIEEPYPTPAEMLNVGDAAGAEDGEWRRPYRPIGPGSAPVLPPQHD